MYTQHGKKKLYQMNTNKLTIPTLMTKQNAESWYKNHLRQKLFHKFPTIKNIHNNDICPICEGILSTKVTLEHIIPKGSNFHSAILPLNLVKCCVECNTSTHSKKSNSKNNSEINPYFESFNISDFFKVTFKHTGHSYRPAIEVISKKNCRIEQSISVYNIEAIYNHRVQVEYNKIITTLKANLTILEKSILRDFIKQLHLDYQSYAEKEKINGTYWVDQNYFGYLICAQIIKCFDTFYHKLYEDIIQERLKLSNVVFSNSNFIKNLVSIDNLDSFKNLIKHNESDIITYHKEQQKHGASITFPGLFTSDPNGQQKRTLIETLLCYYIDNNKTLKSINNVISDIFN